MKKIDIKKNKEEEEKDKKENNADKNKDIKKESEKKAEVSKDNQQSKESKDKNKKDDEEVFVSSEMLKDSGAVLLIIIGVFILYSITSPDYAGNIGLIIGNYLNETSGLASILYPTIIILIGCHILKKFPKKILYFYPLITIGLVWTIETLRCLLSKDLPFLGNPCIAGNFLSSIIESAIGKVGAITILLFLALTLLLLFTGKTFKDLGRAIKSKFLSFCDFLNDIKEKLSVKFEEIKEKQQEKRLQKQMEKAQKAEEKRQKELQKKQEEKANKVPKLEEPNRSMFRASTYTPSVQKNINILQDQDTEEIYVQKAINTKRPITNNLNREQNKYLNNYLQQENRQSKINYDYTQTQNNNRNSEIRTAFSASSMKKNNENIDDFFNKREQIQTSYTQNKQENEIKTAVSNSTIKNDDYLKDYFKQKDNRNKTLEELYGNNEIRTAVSSSSTDKNNEFLNSYFKPQDNKNKTLEELYGNNQPQNNVSTKTEKKGTVVFGTGSALGRTITLLRENDKRNPVENKVKETEVVEPAIEKRQNFLEKVEKENIDPALEKRIKFLQDDSEESEEKEINDPNIQQEENKDFLLYRNEKFFPKNNEENNEEVEDIENEENYEESLPDVDTIFEEDEERRDTNQRIANYKNFLKNSIAKVQEERLNPPAVYEEPIEYFKPSLDILKDKPPIDLSEAFVNRSDELIEKLENFGVTAEVSDILRGPSVTRYELVLGDNIKVSKFTSLQPDLSVFFASKIRIEAPVPGKSCVGIEVPNKKIDPVYLKEIIGSEAFENRKLKIPIALGKDIAGDPVVGDLTKMPHLLVAGSTGSGKSVCMNCLITSILYNFSPNEVQMVMIDPKRVELSMYEGIPHLIDIKATPDYNIITDPKIAALVLNQMTETMDRRYDEFNRFKAKNIFEFNAKSPIKYPYLIIFIDELADLMMVSGGNIETPICRIAQMGRAAGIHLVIATQRPTVNVITGTIKVNVPSRIAFAVTSSIDSRTILDKQGAEELLGKGDMLYQPIEANEPKRVQGAYISTEEIEQLVAFWQEQPPPNNMMPIDIEPPTQEKEEEEKDSNKDALYDEALNIIMAEKYASVSILQRKLKIGYARAGRIIDQMERNGVVGPAEGSKPRKILIGANAGS